MKFISAQILKTQDPALLLQKDTAPQALIVDPLLHVRVVLHVDELHVELVVVSAEVLVIEPEIDLQILFQIFPEGIGNEVVKARVKFGRPAPDVNVVGLV